MFSIQDVIFAFGVGCVFVGIDSLIFNYWYDKNCCNWCKKQRVCDNIEGGK